MNNPSNSPTSCPATYDEGTELARMGIDRFVTDRRPPMATGISLIDFSYSPGEYSVETAPFFSLAMILSPFNAEVGTGTDKLLQHRFSVGELGLVPPNAPYRSRLSSSAAIRYLAVDAQRIAQTLEAVDPAFDHDFRQIFLTTGSGLRFCRPY